MRESVRARHDAERGKANPRDEFRRYLESPLEDGVTDVIGYWGKNSGPHHYPTSGNWETLVAMEVCADDGDGDERCLIFSCTSY